MHVLHIGPGNLFGGIETMMLTVARHSERAGFRSSFAICFEGRLSEELRIHGHGVNILGSTRISRPWTVYSARIRLRKVLARGDCDAVVCHGIWTQALFGDCVNASGVPLIFWLHNEIERSNYLTRWASAVIPRIAIANSRFTARSMAKLYPQIEPHWLHCPVAPTAANRTDRPRLRSQFSVPSGAKIIMHVSRLEKTKGHRPLLDALAHIRDRRDWICWIVGGPQRRSEERYEYRLRKYAREMGMANRVHFLGERTDIPQLMAAADLYCQPNLKPEGFGISFIEALYAGLPVITTQFGGAEEIVDRTCGVLIPPNDRPRFVSALNTLLDDPGLCHAMGESGKARAAQLTDPQQQLHALREIISTAMISDSFNSNLQVHGR